MEFDQKILKKNLELTRALQDVDRLRSDNTQLKLQVIELKEAEQPSQFQDLLIQENIDLKAEVVKLKDVIRQLADPLRR